MRKLFLLSMLFLFSSLLMAQSKITGTVVDESGLGLPGVNVVVEGTTKGAMTNIDGYFEFTVDDVKSKSLVFSSMGYATQTIPIGDMVNFKITMKEDAVGLEEVVVTALGIKREEKSLSYSTQSVSSDELKSVPTTNLLNSLAGKSSGVIVSNSNSGVGGSVKVVMRGNRSIQGNNQPLYVVDGVPITNVTQSQPTGDKYGGNVNSGDGLSTINPEDIESMNILKGASASALYGSQAANGVILITTKSAKDGKAKVNISSSWQMSSPDIMYEFQDTYGQVKDDSKSAWGAKKEGISKSYIEDFFETGNTFINSVSISGGSPMLKNYLSYSNTIGNGIVPGNDLEKHMLSYRGKTKLFDEFIEVDGRFNYTIKEIDNPPSSPGSYFNPLTGLYMFPAGTTEFNVYKNKVTKFDPNRNYDTQNWMFDEDIQQNPYWLTNFTPTRNETNRLISKLDFKFNLSKELNLVFRGSYDKTNYEYERKAHAGTQTTISHANGRYILNTNENIQMYGDVLLSFNKRIDKLDVNANLGSSITDSKTYRTSFDSNTKGLYWANVFNLTNMIDGGDTRLNSESRRQLQAVYGALSFGYNSMVYLDVTGRNDWSSTLPEKNNSYFYPSLGTSFVISELLNQINVKPKILDFSKLRFSYSQVGNDMPWGVINPTDNLRTTGDIQVNRTTFDPDLKPEESTATELGLDVRLFGGRLGLDVAWYSTTTKNQRFRKQQSNADGEGGEIWINAGEIENKGFEVSIDFKPIQMDDFDWTGWVNFSTNENEVISLPDNYKDEGFTIAGGEYDIKLYEGGKFGDMYAEVFKRDDKGNIVVDETGKPIKDEKKQKIGNVSADFRFSIRNEFVYKGISLAFLIDGRLGGQVISYTQNQISARGVSKESAQARDNGGIHLPSVYTDGALYNQVLKAEDWYTSAPTGETGLYDADNIRLRELSLGYIFPKSILNYTKVINSAKVSFVARNLFFLMVDAPYDPETVISTTSNGLIGDIFGLPMQRTYGITLNLGF